MGFIGRSQNLKSKNSTITWFLYLHISNISLTFAKVFRIRQDSDIGTCLKRQKSFTPITLQSIKRIGP